MLTVRKTIRADGSIAIRIGRGRATVLKTSGKADAFIAGAKVAHLQLSAQILPILKITDTRDV